MMAHATAGPPVVLRGVEFAYGPERTVFSDLNLALQPGERLGVIGPNGGGKTTMLHLLVGLLRPVRGLIEIFGQPRRSEADFRAVRRKVGLLFQNSDDQLFCPTVYEDVAFGPLNLGHNVQETDHIVRTTLAQLDLDGYGERITYQLSQGEKRLVALATVVAMQPRVLLLDEPTAGLDDVHQRRLMDILIELPQEMIIVSHDRAFLDTVATRRGTLRDGKIST